MFQLWGQSGRHSINASTSDYANECQWYDVLLELHIKSTYKLTSEINKSEERRELPTIPQSTHTIEWLARTSFRHRPVRLNVPQQRKHNVPQERKPRLLGDVVCSSLTPPLLCTEGATLVLKAACTCVET